MRFGAGSFVLLVAALASTAGCEDWRGPRLPEDHRARYGCIDVALTASRDATVPPTSLVIDLQMDNECHRPMPIDVGKLDVWVEGAEAKYHLMFWDPKREIRPLHIEPTVRAYERIRADGTGDLDAVSRLCFDAAPALGMPAGAPTCFPLGAPGPKEIAQ